MSEVGFNFWLLCIIALLPPLPAFLLIDVTLSLSIREAEYEEEIEMNGLLCGPKQPETLHHGEECTKAVVWDLVEVETHGLSPLKPKLEERGVWAEVRPAPVLSYMTTNSLVSFPETSVSHANDFATICGWCNVSRPNLNFYTDQSVALYGMSLCWIKGKAFWGWLALQNSFWCFLLGKWHLKSLMSLTRR